MNAFLIVFFTYFPQAALLAIGAENGECRCMKLFEVESLRRRNTTLGNHRQLSMYDNHLAWPDCFRVLQSHCRHHYKRRLWV
jgi:hypothetical protein